jgi:hypothetical protein
MPAMHLLQLRIEHSHFAPHIKPLADSIGAVAPPQDNKTAKKGDDASQNRSAETRTHSDLHCSTHRGPTEESTCPYARGATAPACTSIWPSRGVAAVRRS